MDYEDYYKIFTAYFEKFNTHEEIFEKGKLMEKALFAAKHHVASCKWYENGVVE